MGRIPALLLPAKLLSLFSLPKALFLFTIAVGSGGAWAAPDSLVINEVLYDAVGSDEGGEFVELLLTGGEPIDLDRVTIERGNGNRAGDWSQVWRGEAGDRLRPDHHYVVGGSSVVPAPSAVIELGLQNGPDACRVLVDGRVVDVVGWGTHEHSEYYAGEPAPDVGAGSSLGRVPDGHDTANNLADLIPLTTPSPGDSNRRPASLHLRSPGHRSSGELRPMLEIEWAIEDEGTIPITSLEVSAWVCAATEIRGAITVTPLDRTASGTLLLGPLDPGTLDVCLTAVPSLERAAPDPDTVRIAARAGPGPLLVSEFLFRPAPGAPEWLELVNVAADTLLVDRFSLADARLAPVALAGAAPLAPGELLVVAEHPLPDRTPALVLGSRWPRLNDSGTPIADRIRILDAEGRTSDDVAYAGDWAPPAVSVERVSIEIPSADRAAWSAAPESPSPGRRNGVAREFAPFHGFLRLEPPLVSSTARDAVFLRLARPLESGSVTVHTLDGRVVRRFSGSDLVGRRFLSWDARGEDGNRLAPGLYLVSAMGEIAPDLGGGSGSDPGSESGSGSRTERERAARATFIVSP